MSFLQHTERHELSAMLLSIQARSRLLETRSDAKVGGVGRYASVSCGMAQ